MCVCDLSDRKIKAINNKKCTQNCQDTSVALSSYPPHSIQLSLYTQQAILVPFFLLSSSYSTARTKTHTHKKNFSVAIL